MTHFAVLCGKLCIIRINEELCMYTLNLITENVDMVDYIISSLRMLVNF